MTIPGLKRSFQALKSIRMTLTLGYLLMVSLLLLLFGSGMYVFQDRNIEHNVDTQLDTFLRTESALLVTLHASPGSFSACRALTPMERVLQQSEIVMEVSPGGIKAGCGPLTRQTFLQVQEHTTAIAHTLQSGIPAMLNTTLSVQGTDGKEGDVSYRLAFVSLSSRQDGRTTLIVGLSREQVQQGERLLLQVIVLFSMILLLLSLFAGYWLAGTMLRPLRTIVQTANEIGESDLHRRLLVTKRDELGELATTFNRMLTRLETAFERQRQFIANTSHELRTPLTIVNLEVQRTLEHPCPDEEHRQALAVIQAENEQMSRVVDDLLFLARADAGHMVLRWEAIDLSDLTVDVVERLRPLAKQQGISLITGTLPELLIQGDRGYLNRMLTNLIENAIKYTQGRGNRVCVETIERGTRQERWGIIRIEDNGPGIAEEHLPHLFERFYRVEGNTTYAKQQERDIRGSGLGLAIVQWVTQMHHGEITVQSTIGTGTIFEVSFPLHK